MQGFPGTRDAEKVLTKFGDAAIQKDWMLAWTVQDILAEDVLPPKQAWTLLGLRSPPVMDVVSPTAGSALVCLQTGAISSGTVALSQDLGCCP